MLNEYIEAIINKQNEKRALVKEKLRKEDEAKSLIKSLVLRIDSFNLLIVITTEMIDYSHKSVADYNRLLPRVEEHMLRLKSSWGEIDAGYALCPKDRLKATHITRRELSIADMYRITSECYGRCQCIYQALKDKYSNVVQIRLAGI